MKRNLLESFDLEVKPGLFKALKRMSPDSEQTMFQHLSIVHASILGGLIQKSKKANGSKAIKNLLELGNHKGDIIDEISEIFNSENQLTDLKKLGNSLLSFVFEDGTDTAFEKIQHFLSEKYQTTEEELIEVNRLVAPFSMAQLGQIVHFEKLTPEQISALLEYNEPIIGKKYPGLAQVLGLQTMMEEPQESDFAATPNPKNSASPDHGDVNTEQTGVSEPTKSDIVKKEREDFFNALWPWVLVLIISGLALYIMKKFEDNTPDEPVAETSFPFIQSDSLVISGKNSYTLPNNKTLEVIPDSPLDSLLIFLEKNQPIGDTIRFKDSFISFQDTTSTLTIAANNELAGLVSILQAYPQVNVGVDMKFDSTFFKNYASVIEERSDNLANYFTAFGLEDSRYVIYSQVTNLGESNTNPEVDSIQSPNQTALPSIQQIQLSFYPTTTYLEDTLKIQ